MASPPTCSYRASPPWMQADRRPSGRQSTVLAWPSPRLAVKSGLSVAARKRWHCRRPRIRVVQTVSHGRQTGCWPWERTPPLASERRRDCMAQSACARRPRTPRHDGAGDRVPVRGGRLADACGAGSCFRIPRPTCAGMLATTGVAFARRAGRAAPSRAHRSRRAYPWIVALGTVLITARHPLPRHADRRARALLPVGRSSTPATSSAARTTLAQVALALAGYAVVLHGATQQTRPGARGVAADGSARCWSHAC